MQAILKILIIIFIGSLFQLSWHQNIFAAEKKSLLKKSDWEKLTKDVDYQDDIKRVNKEKQKRTEKQNYQQPKKPFQFPTFNLGSVAQILLIVIVAIVILFFISRFVLNNNLKNQKVDQLIISTEEAEDKLLETDLDYLLRNALQKSDWRIALRLYYLKVLKTMHEFHYIEWSREKTNQQYNYELSTWNLLPDWKNITSQYERTWYGERPLEKQIFQEKEKQIQSILQNIQTNPSNKTA